MKKFFSVIFLAFIFLSGCLSRSVEKSSTPLLEVPPPRSLEKKTNALSSDPLNLTYTIDGRSFTLFNGKAQQKVADGYDFFYFVEVFGDIVWGDINRDGEKDAVLVLTQSIGQKGKLFYLVVAIYDPATQKFFGSNSFLLGNLISPQNISLSGEGDIMIEYLKRNPDDSPETPPSIPIERKFFLQGDSLLEKK